MAPEEETDKAAAAPLAGGGRWAEDCLDCLWVLVILSEVEGAWQTPSILFRAHFKNSFMWSTSSSAITYMLMVIVPVLAVEAEDAAWLLVLADFCMAEIDTNTTLRASSRFLMRDLTSFKESEARWMLLENTLSFTTEPASEDIQMTCVVSNRSHIREAPIRPDQKYQKKYNEHKQYSTLLCLCVYY